MPVVLAQWSAASHHVDRGFSVLTDVIATAPKSEEPNERGTVPKVDIATHHDDKERLQVSDK